MRVRVSSCTVLALLVLSAPAWAAKVKVCHVPPGNPGNFHTITISENALQAHLGHGDLLGECFAHCSQLCDDGNACTIDACDASEHCVNDHPPVNCDDSNLCTIDSCNPATGCETTPKVCADGALCSVDTCDPLTGNCAFPPVACPAGQTCNPDNGSCESQTPPCPCAAFPEFNAVLAGQTQACSTPGGFVFFLQTTTGFVSASELGASCDVYSSSPPIHLSITPEQGAACVELLMSHCGAAG